MGWMVCFEENGRLNFFNDDHLTLSKRLRLILDFLLVLKANLPYVVWIVAFNTSLLLAYLMIHTWTSNYVKNSSAPAIFDAMNKNGMLVFLVVSLVESAKVFKL